MKIRSPLQASALALCLGLAAGGAQAQNLLADGDFENFAGQVANGDYTTVFAPGTLGAWTVGDTSVDLVRNAYGAINNISVDLSGTPGPGSISQSFMAQAGYSYQLSFDYYKNTPGTDLGVNFAGQASTYGPAMAVTSVTLMWTADASGTQWVTFSGGEGVTGPTLDNVMLTVTAVPEPSALALMLAGIGAIGFVARRRKTA